MGTVVGGLASGQLAWLHCTAGEAHRSESTGTGPSQCIPSLWGPHDATVANDNHIPALELLLELTNKACLHSMELLQQAERHLWQLVSASVEGQRVAMSGRGGTNSGGSCVGSE